MGLLDSFPSTWRTTVTVKSGGGRDKYGDPLPSTIREIPGCLLAPRSSSEPNYQSAYVEGAAVLYTPSGSGITSTDQVITPEGSVLQGTWSVNGDPIRWPWGEEIQLRKDGT